MIQIVPLEAELLIFQKHMSESKNIHKKWQKRIFYQTGNRWSTHIGIYPYIVLLVCIYDANTIIENMATIFKFKMATIFCKFYHILAFWIHMFGIIIFHVMSCDNSNRFVDL